MPLALVAAVTLLVSCSGDDAGDTTVPTTALSSTTSAPPGSTTTPPPSATTTIGSGTTVAGPTPVPEGSGCTPDSEVLPDGVWYGVLTSYDENMISFDLACWFNGDDAIVAAAEDGEESPPPNDYHVRNENTLIRDLDVDPSIPVTWYLSGDPNDAETGEFEAYADALATRDFWLGLWVTITDGAVSQIEEQWVP